MTLDMGAGAARRRDLVQTLQAVYDASYPPSLFTPPETATGAFTWQARVTTPPPANAGVGIDRDIAANATRVWIDKDTATASDVTAPISAMKVGDRIGIVVTADTTNWVQYELTGVPIPQGGGAYFEIPVKFLSDGAVTFAPTLGTAVSVVRGGPVVVATEQPTPIEPEPGPEPAPEPLPEPEPAPEPAPAPEP